MAYGNQQQQTPQPQVTVQQSVGGPDPNDQGQFAGGPTKKQKNQQQQGGPKNLNPLQQYLRNDPTFRTQSAQYNHALQSYRNQLFGSGNPEHPVATSSPTSSLGQILQQFQETRQNLGDQRRQDMPQMESDFASRGLVTSGLFGKAAGDYQHDFQKQMQELVKSKQNAVTGILNSWQQVQQQIADQKQQARMEAIRRRVASL